MAPGVARRVIGDRKGDDGGGERHGGRHQHGADDDVEIGGPEKFAIGLERELVVDEPGKFVDREEALGQQREQRAEIDDAEPQQRRRQQQEEQQAADGARTGRRARRAGRRGLAGSASGATALIAASSIRCRPAA